MKNESHNPEDCIPRGRGPNRFYPKPYELTEKDLNKKSVTEELQEAGYLPGENDWTQTGPLALLWKLPFPLNIVVLTPVMAVLITLFILCLIPRKRR